MTASHMGQRKESHPKQERVFSRTNMLVCLRIHRRSKAITSWFLLSRALKSGRWVLELPHTFRGCSPRRRVCSSFLASSHLLEFLSFLLSLSGETGRHTLAPLFTETSTATAAYLLLSSCSFSTTGQENTAHLPRIPIASYNHRLNIPRAVLPSVFFIFPVLTIIPLSKTNMTEIMHNFFQLSMLSCSASCVLLK